ncbi:MAG: bifunctional UDP-N-acetylglucosamine diphosphorylase/glucosamine-1-phosphate N-acetyltransferase GlmU [Pseudomonadota bacterium]
MARTCLAIILAAGEGTRMRSNLPKVLHPVAGLPMITHVMRVSVAAQCDAIAVVAGKGAEAVSEIVVTEKSDTQVFEQTERLGTGHAVLAARKALESGHDDILVLFGDTPLLTPETLKRMRSALAEGAVVAVLGFRANNPTGYGRLLEKDGKLQAIREERDATDEERKINFCNGGIMGLAGDRALSLLDAIGNDNSKGEYYLTDVVEIANEQGHLVQAVEADETEVMGVNTRDGLAEVEALWQQAARKRLMQSGVSMQAPETVFLNADTVIEPDVILEPNIVFGPGVTVKSGSRVRAFSHIEGATVGENAEVGPYARLRSGTDLAEKAKVGNFVEVKNAKVASGAKVNHLTYIGDAEIGEKANIGAGTITCNYDGINKHKTTIGAGAFIGSNSALVAPVTIGDGAYIASGSVIVEDVPSDGLGLARGRQTNKEGRGREIRERNQRVKDERNKGS